MPASGYSEDASVRERRFDVHAYVFGLPDGYWPTFKCWLLGHDWYECDPECCGRSWCWRCRAPKPFGGEAMLEAELDA